MTLYSAPLVTHFRCCCLSFMVPCFSIENYCNNEVLLGYEQSLCLSSSQLCIFRGHCLCDFVPDNCSNSKGYDQLSIAVIIVMYNH